MLRGVIFLGLTLVLLAGLASAGEGELILRVDKSVGAEALRAAGMLYLADLDEDYLVFGDVRGRERLEQRGISVETVALLSPGEEIFLLRPRTFQGEVLFSGLLTGLGGGDYLATMETRRIEDLEFLPFSRARLIPGRFPPTERSRTPASPVAVTANPHVAAMTARVSGDTLWKYISQLSGREPVLINGELDTLRTRYSYSPKVNDAADYLVERFEDYGIDVEFHEYVVGLDVFHAVDFVDPLNGWVVGSSQKVFRTRDGGFSYEKQKPGAPLKDFQGICFLDTLNGWIAGTGGTIRHTQDGGASWSVQTSPVGMNLREVFFLDELNGWIVGYGGTIIRTMDGGLNWSAVASGTGDDLYGCHFQAADRGWACGENGTVIFWNGTSWSAQTSGSSEHLLDVFFVNDDTGWMAGGGQTVLKTTDGGLTWSPQTVPAEASPFFKSVCFVDTLSGWVVGLNGTIIHTSDGGADWEIQDTGTLFGLRWVDFASATEGWSCGYGSTILHTDDGGATWESQRENLPATALKFLKNVVATKPGTVSDEQVIICGHFDSTSEDPQNLAPGADDNASGTAAVVEAARVVAEYPFERTVKFLCFSGEEQGLFGSGEYAGDARAAGDSIIGALNFDMIGFVNPAPEDIDIIGDYQSEWLVDFAVDCAAAYVPSLLTRKSINPNDVYSDHASFWKAGYSSLLGIEDENLSYPYYHTTNDTLGNLTQAFAADVVKMGVAALAELAGIDTTSSVPGRRGKALVAMARPNPFTAVTKISFALGSKSGVQVKVVNVEGRVISSLLDDELPAGPHEVAWQATDDSGRRVAPGIYFAEVTAGSRTAAAKIVVLR
ncbi:MAG: YCF48-related protein [bacterium]